VNPMVSVVIPTYKRGESLKSCLDAVLDQDFDRSGYEVIVVDDEPSERTAELVAAYSGMRNPVRYVRVDQHRGPAAARNLGWRAAAGPIIAFTDDDCRPSRTWLGEGLKAFDAGVDGVSGRVVVPLPPAPTDFQHNLTGLENARFVTANCFYKRDALSCVDGFDERFPLPWREDTDLWFTLLESGANLIDAPDAVVVHPAREAPWGASLKEQRKSLYNALLYKKHPGLYCRFVQKSPRAAYYGAVIGASTAFFGLATGRRLTFAAGALWWAALTTRFIAKRLEGTSHSPEHVAEMLLTSALVPPLSLYWRLRGALRFRVVFF
jgi:glycosyltransferase involved in cell wall biosynthesis